MNKKGFTIIEIIISLSLITIISVVCIVIFKKNNNTNNIYKKNVKELIKASEVYYNSNYMDKNKIKFDNSFNISIRDIYEKGLISKSKYEYFYNYSSTHVNEDDINYLAVLVEKYNNGFVDIIYPSIDNSLKLENKEIYFFENENNIFLENNKDIVDKINNISKNIDYNYYEYNNLNNDCEENSENKIICNNLKKNNLFDGVETSENQINKYSIKLKYFISGEEDKKELEKRTQKIDLNLIGDNYLKHIIKVKHNNSEINNDEIDITTNSDVSISFDTSSFNDVVKEKLSLKLEYSFGTQEYYKIPDGSIEPTIYKKIEPGEYEQNVNVCIQIKPLYFEKFNNGEKQRKVCRNIKLKYTVPKINKIIYVDSDIYNKNENKINSICNSDNDCVVYRKSRQDNYKEIFRQKNVNSYSLEKYGNLIIVNTQYKKSKNDNNYTDYVSVVDVQNDNIDEIYNGERIIGGNKYYKFYSSSCKCWSDYITRKKNFLKKILYDDNSIYLQREFEDYDESKKKNNYGYSYDKVNVLLNKDNIPYSLGDKILNFSKCEKSCSSKSRCGECEELQLNKNENTNFENISDEDKDRLINNCNNNNLSKYLKSIARSPVSQKETCQNMLKYNFYNSKSFFKIKVDNYYKYYFSVKNYVNESDKLYLFYLKDDEYLIDTNEFDISNESNKYDIYLIFPDDAKTSNFNKNIFNSIYHIKGSNLKELEKNINEKDNLYKNLKNSFK